MEGPRVCFACPRYISGSRRRDIQSYTLARVSTNSEALQFIINCFFQYNYNAQWIETIFPASHVEMVIIVIIDQR